MTCPVGRMTRPVGRSFSISGRAVSISGQTGSMSERIVCPPFRGTSVPDPMTPLSSPKTIMAEWVSPVLESVLSTWERDSSNFS